MLSRLTVTACLLTIALLLAACDKLGSLADNRNIEVADQLSAMQIAILEDAGVSDESATEAADDQHAVSNASHDPSHESAAEMRQRVRVAVVSVVDQTLFGDGQAEVAADEDPAAATKKQDALRRERQVRQGINARLVRNSLIDVVQPASEHLDLARAEVITIDSAALSQATAMLLGEQLQVDYIISVLIDREGQDVDITAQHVADGAIIFQQTRDWSARLRSMPPATEGE
ncbi:MAG: hypothetical protein H7A35_13685 [Planctomycetales bacterium]|nr:hypothetical protein [bacterium]UNM07893.1 MAG: hypothetical protein H7A35_13685 [Planctomycetales bacterium]